MGKFKHGEAVAKTPEYTAWLSMKNRCYIKSNKAYHVYGGRGIKVCSRWRRNYSKFLEDMGRRPTPQHSLDRIDNSKGYSPENCRWATKREQNINKRDVRLVTVDGITKCVTEWSEEFGIPKGSIFNRLNRGWPSKSAVSEPIVKGRRFMPVSTSASVIERHYKGNHSRRCGGTQCRYL